MADVFISYASPSQHLVERLAKDLAKAGFTVRWDRSLLSGSFLPEAIAREIDQASAVVVIWDTESVGSAWVYSEAERARTAGKLVQIKIPAVAQSSVPLPFGSLHLVSFDNLGAILDAIDSHLRVTRIDDWRPSIATSIRLQLWKILQSRYDLRVSFAALLRIANAGEYLIVRNLHRQEVFAPLGGVYKYFDAAGTILDSLEFRQENTAWPNDVANDIRGFLPCRHAFAFRKWFGRGENREDAEACLRRELSEELAEIKLATRIAPLSKFRFEMVRRVEEAPRWLPGQSFAQYRIFDVYQPVITDSEPETREFLRDLLKVASAHDDLDLVTADEIKSGRSKSGRVIGHHAAYLFGDRSYRPDAPMYSDRVLPRKD